ncbi:uncharacterized protein LOC126375745 [Pectinophora gossypiella]|nr:uncharacterized protein LOC126375745 [Pectinophora gossypiella]
MSLLSAVLQEVDKVSTEDLKKHRDVLLPGIKDLSERLQLLSFALQQNFIDTYVNFTPTKSIEQLNYRNRKSNIVSDYEKYAESITTYRQKFGDKDDEFSTCCKKLNVAYELFQQLCIVAEAKKVLELANQEFGRYNYKDAMLSVKDLQNQLKNLKFEGNSAKALSNLIAQSENQLALYSAHLSVEWEDIFSWEQKKGLFSHTYSLSVQQSDPTLIQKVLKTLHATERLNAELGLFSHFFIDQLLHNVIRHNCDIFTEDHIGAIIFNIKIDLNDTKKPNYQTIFNNLTAIFEFLHSTLGSQFDNGKKFIEVFAESIRDKFFNKIIEDCIRINLPSCDSSYQNYKNIVVELDSFNKFLIDLKFVDADQSPLNKYVNDTECVLYNKKCDKLLYDVRTLLNESLSSGTVIVGTVKETVNDSILDVSSKETLWDLNKPLFLPRCVITQNVKKVMTMIVEHLEESAKLPDKYSRQLVSYIRDIAIMYQCIVPKKFKVNLECCPLDIALFFNNCFYLAHGLLGPPWKTILPGVLADQVTTMLLECIQDLRVLGLEKMSLYLQNQKNAIMQSIEAKDTSPWTHEVYEQFDTAINKAILLMRDLKSSWLNILPSRMYEMSLCTLIQALCQAILDRIFADGKPIEEELVYMLAVRLEDILSEVNVLFDEPIKLEDKVNVWTKFNKMPQLLKAQLLEIAEIWNENRDQLQSFSCEEIRQITAFLIYALVFVVIQVGATTKFYNYEDKTDQLAQEAKNRAVTIIDGPKYVALPSPTPAPAAPTNYTQPEQRPPSKPPNHTPDKPGKPKYIEVPRLYYGSIQNLPSIRSPYPKQVKIQHPPNSVYKYHKVIPLQQHRNTLYPKHQQLVFAASTSKPAVAVKSPKFSLPVETINGIRTDFVRPPHFANSTTTSSTTTTATTTTTKYLRTKRIWPKHVLEKMKANNTTGNNTNENNTKVNKNDTDSDLSSAGSHHKIIILTENTGSSTAHPATRPPYRRVTRNPSKKKPSTAAPANLPHIEPNDWVPIIPSHYPLNKVRKSKQTTISRRSDRSDVYLSDPNESPVKDKRMMYLQSFGLIPVGGSPTPTAAAAAARKNIIFIGRSKQLNPYVYSGYRGKPVVHTTHIKGDYQTDESNPPKIITRIKHHHHHHHHKYVKTVEKPVRVEVPKPVSVPVPVPVPVKVEQKVPYPVPVKVPHPVPVKVVEKQYVPKPYPVVQYVPKPYPVVQQVKVPQPVPVHIEKQVPVEVPKPYPVAVPVEKKVPVPYPVRILVPHPVPYETKVPVPVKEPVEVIKHVAVRVPYPQPYPVKVPQPVPVPYEKRVPYPVEVEKKVPMPFKVLVPERVEVEKRVPVYIPRPYPVEKRVPVPVKVPYPVKVPIRVPVGIPIIVHPSPSSGEQVVTSGLSVGDDGSQNNQQLTHYSYSVNGNTVTTSPQNTVTLHGNVATDNPHQTVTFHGNTITQSPHQTVTFHGRNNFNGFQSRMDVFDETTTAFGTTIGSSTQVELSTPENTSTSVQSITETTTKQNITTPTLQSR